MRKKNVAAKQPTANKQAEAVIAVPRRVKYRHPFLCTELEKLTFHRHTAIHGILHRPDPAERPVGHNSGRRFIQQAGIHFRPNALFTVHKRGGDIRITVPQGVRARVFRYIVTWNRQALFHPDQRARMIAVTVRQQHQYRTFRRGSGGQKNAAYFVQVLQRATRIQHHEARRQAEQIGIAAGQIGGVQANRQVRG